MNISIKHHLLIASGIACLAVSPAVFALNYFELEVYPYRTASKGEVEIENSTTHTSRGAEDQPAPGNNEGLTRSSLELTYGATDKTEITYYRDYARPRGGSFEYAASRYRVRTRFYEKGELPVDLGLYFEVEAPRGEKKEYELRGIIEKDFGRWTVDFNPILELAREEKRQVELQYAASIIYRPSEYWQPRLDFFGDFGPIDDFEPRDEQKHLISPAVDFKLGHGFFATLGIAFGLTDATEHRLLRAQLEWEF